MAQWERANRGHLISKNGLSIERFMFADFSIYILQEDREFLTTFKVIKNILMNFPVVVFKKVYFEVTTTFHRKIILCSTILFLDVLSFRAR